MAEKGQKVSPRSAMELALRSAEKGVGFVSPNPPVGCVILDRNQRFLADGHHKICGGPHAEINALNKIKDKKLLNGAFVYVTLEPCAHLGKTPPCAEALTQYPLGCVIYGMEDPNPVVSGAGIKKLRSKGIPIKPFSFFQKEIKKLYEIFAFNMREKRAWVALKTAVTLDGMIALSDGSSRWITSEESRKYVSRLRGRYDGVLVGVGTFLQDNPSLNSREKPWDKKKNKVVVLDPKGISLKHIESSRLARTRPLSHIVVVTADSAQSPSSLHSPPFSQSPSSSQSPAFPRKRESSQLTGTAHETSAFAGRTGGRTDGVERTGHTEQTADGMEMTDSAKGTSGVGTTGGAERTEDERSAIQTAHQSELGFILKKQALNTSGQFNLKSLLSHLYTEEGITSLLVEGGAEVFSAFLQQKAAQRLYQFISPKFLGGGRGKGVTETFFVKQLSQAPTLRDRTVIELGPDLLLTGRF